MQGPEWKSKLLPRESKNILGRLRGLALTSGDQRSLDIDWKIQGRLDSKVQKRTFFFVLVAKILNSLTASAASLLKCFDLFFSFPSVRLFTEVCFEWISDLMRDFCKQQILEVCIARWISTRATTIKYPRRTTRREIQVCFSLKFSSTSPGNVSLREVEVVESES